MKGISISSYSCSWRCLVVSSGLKKLWNIYNMYCIRTPHSQTSFFCISFVARSNTKKTGEKRSGKKTEATINATITVQEKNVYAIWFCARFTTSHNSHANVCSPRGKDEEMWREHEEEFVTLPSTIFIQYWANLIWLDLCVSFQMQMGIGRAQYPMNAVGIVFRHSVLLDRRTVYICSNCRVLQI